MNKLEREKKAVKNSDLPKPVKNQLLNQYLEEVKNSERIKSQHTLAKHLQKLKIIFTHNDFNPLKPLTEEDVRNVRNQIQDSEYHRHGNDYAKRSKQDFWTIFKYWIQYSNPQDWEDIKVKASFTSNKEDVDVQADTKPEDLPTEEDMRKLLNTLQNVSHSKTGLRNAVFYGLIWDLGTRVGETLNIKMKDIQITENRTRIYIHGNKGSGDDWIRLFQTEQLLKKYVQQHPCPDDGEAYLFPDLYNNKPRKKITRKALKKKMLQAKTQAKLSFKTYGEPFHIFRKAMTTFYWVNNILTWEDICKRQRKKVDSTKPDYLLMAMEDVEQSAAEGFGLTNTTEQTGGVMKGKPLLPKQCPNCDTLNTCLDNQCHTCQTTLPQNTLPTPEIKTDEEIENAEIKGKIKGLMQALENNNTKLEDLI